MSMLLNIHKNLSASMDSQQLTEGVYNLSIFLVYRMCPFEDSQKAPKSRFAKAFRFVSI